VQLLLLRRLLVPLLVEVPQQDVRLLGDYALLPGMVLSRHVEGISVSAAHSCGRVVVLSLRRTDVVGGSTCADFGEVVAVVRREILQKVGEGPAGGRGRRRRGGGGHVWGGGVGP